MQNYHNHFGRLLEAYRIEMDYTQKMLAEHTKLTPKFISLLESGKRQPSLKTLTKLVRALNMNPTKIFYAELPDTNEQASDLIRLAGLCNIHKKTKIALDLLKVVLNNLSW